MMHKAPFPMVREVPYMGVIWVVHEASKLGFWNGHPEWCNLGQGQPEVGPLDGAPPRLNTVELEPGDHAYGPVGGTAPLREAVADLYNRTYRRGMKPYSAENVSIASGGRLTLTRLFAILEDGARILYKCPDYTAYEDYLNYARQRCGLFPVIGREEDGFSIPPERLEEALCQHQASAFVFSNPCNPTGEVVAGEDLARYADMARRHNTLFGSDEFYSHYVYAPDAAGVAPADVSPVSMAAYVEDVDRDPVLVVDGLTKNHRYPGWRAGWTLGPRHCIEMLNRAASALDGGPSMLMQRMSLAALEPQRFEAETRAVRTVFARKRALMLERLAAMGIRPAAQPQGTFYVWASIRDLPPPLNEADAFFHACLARKVMTVPGRFFDVRPYRSRPNPEPYASWVRFSYGPPEAVVAEGLRRIEQVIANA